MTHRERVLAALRHEEPDRVPVDLGGTFVTGINLGAYERLKSALGVTSATRVASLRSQIAAVDEEILRRFDVDTRGLLPGSPERRPIEPLPDGSYRDEWGVARRKPAEGGHYIETGHPFAGEPALADLERHAWPDADDPGYSRGIAGAARRLRAETDYAVLLSLPVGIVHQTQFLRGYEGWLTDLLVNPRFFKALMERVTEIWLRIAGNLLAAAGESVDVVLYGDDIAFQDRPIMSRDLYLRLVRPWHRKIIEFIRSRTPAKILYHTCGAVAALIPDLIDLGIDALNPVQVSAQGMDTLRLKREFGDRVAFWGGIDTQRVLPRGTPADVREEVRRRLRDLGPGGGYVLSAVHNIQREVPPANICALFEAAREFGRYPLPSG